MSVSHFDEILYIIGPSIQLENSRWCSSIDPGQQLVMSQVHTYYKLGLVVH